MCIDTIASLVHFTQSLIAGQRLYLLPHLTTWRVIRTVRSPVKTVNISSLNSYNSGNLLRFSYVNIIIMHSTRNYVAGWCTLSIFIKTWINLMIFSYGTRLELSSPSLGIANIRLQVWFYYAHPLAPRSASSQATNYNILALVYTVHTSHHATSSTYSRSYGVFLLLSCNSINYLIIYP